MPSRITSPLQPKYNAYIQRDSPPPCQHSVDVLLCIFIMTYTNGATSSTANGVTSGNANGNSNGTETKTHTDGSAFLDDLVAISPSIPEKVPGLLEDILTHGLAFSGNKDVKARNDLLDAARSLVYALETPREAMIRYCWSQVSELGQYPVVHGVLTEQSTAYAAIETGVDLGLFALLSQDPSPKNASYLAERTDADPMLMGMYRDEHPRIVSTSRLTNSPPS